MFECFIANSKSIHFSRLCFAEDSNRLESVLNLSFNDFVIGLLCMILRSEMDRSDDIDWNNVLVWSVYIFIVVLLIGGVVIVFATAFYFISLDYQLRKTRRRVFISERNQRIRDHKHATKTLLTKENKVAEVVAYLEVRPFNNCLSHF